MPDIRPGTKVTLCGEECTVVSRDNSNEFVLTTLACGSMCSVPRRWVERALNAIVSDKVPKHYAVDRNCPGKIVSMDRGLEYVTCPQCGGSSRVTKWPSLDVVACSTCTLPPRPVVHQTLPVEAGRVAIDPDADLCAAYGSWSGILNGLVSEAHKDGGFTITEKKYGLFKRDPDVVVTDDPEADEPYVIGNAD